MYDRSVAKWSCEGPFAQCITNEDLGDNSTPDIFVNHIRGLLKQALAQAESDRNTVTAWHGWRYRICVISYMIEYI